MSAGVCSVCLGAAPFFTGDTGQSPEGRVVSVLLKDIHGFPRHVVICTDCARVITATFARIGRRAMTPKAVAQEGIKACAVCDQTYGEQGGHHCPGPLTEDDDGPPPSN